MGDYGQVVDNALTAFLIMGIAIGVAIILGAWAIWHFVLSHVSIGWS